MPHWDTPRPSQDGGAACTPHSRWLPIILLRMRLILPPAALKESAHQRSSPSVPSAPEATLEMALCVSAHAQRALPLPRWRRGGDRPEEGCGSGVPLWSAALAPRSTMIPHRGDVGPQEGNRRQAQAGGAGPGARRGPCQCLDVGLGLQPQRVASETGLAAALRLPGVCERRQVPSGLRVLLRAEGSPQG